MSEVCSLGYVIISSGDLDAWQKFATDLLGLQVAERTPDRLRLRNDDKIYRAEVVRGEAEGVTVLGWEVNGKASLESLVVRLEENGYPVARQTTQTARARGVTELVSFTDPDGMSVELFYGQMVDRNRFISPTGATFLTGEGGLGHVFQLVNEEEPYRHLYLDVLGFKLSDFIDFGPIVGTFTHCNPRHHSFAFAPVPDAPKGIGHIMFEVDDIDIVGRAYDKVLKEKAAPLAMSFGRHSNDQMLSFYVNSPSGFQIEYGTGGVIIDDETWVPKRFDVPGFWGHERQLPA
jgi:2,3-dihydroxybiphenyl 1,2-dioxygenase